MKRRLTWRFWVKCPICGRRPFRACGARASEKIAFGGGYYYWRKWNSCSEYAPGGLKPGPLLDDAGDLDDVRGVDGIPECSDWSHVTEVV